MSQSIRYPHLQITKSILSRQLGTSVNIEKYPKTYDNESFRYCLPSSLKERKFKVKPRYSLTYPGLKGRLDTPKCSEQRLPAVVQVKPSMCTSLWDFKHEQFRHSIVAQAYIQGKTNCAVQKPQEEKLQHVLENIHKQLNLTQLYNLFDNLELDLGHTEPWQKVHVCNSSTALKGSESNVKSEICSKNVDNIAEDKDQLPYVNDKGNDLDKDREDKPTIGQLKEVENILIDKLPQFFRGCLFCGKEHPKIVFINKYYDKEKKYFGKMSYGAQLVKIFFKMRLIYPQIEVNLVSVDIDEQDGLINMRWQICSIPHYEYVLSFIMSCFKEFDKSSMLRYIDGYSTFTVGKDGLIHKHEVDRRIRDTNRVLLKKVSPLTNKLLPNLQGTSFTEISSMNKKESEDNS